MESERKPAGKLSIHQYLILGSLKFYPNGINIKSFYAGMSKIFPEHFTTRKTFYYHLDRMERQGLIEADLVNTIPPEKIIKISDSGEKMFQTISKPLKILHEKIARKTTKRKNSHEKTQTMQEIKFSLDQAEQIELITGIQYQILNFTDQEMEEISESQAKKLELSAKAIMNSLCRILGISLE